MEVRILPGDPPPFGPSARPDSRFWRGPPRCDAMKLLVDRLTETPASEDFEVGAAWWRAHAPRGTGLPEEPAEPFRVRVRAWKQGEDLLLEGGHRGRLRARMRALPRALSSAASRILPTRAGARWHPRARRSRGRGGARPRRPVPRRRARDGLVPRSGGTVGFGVSRADHAGAAGAAAVPRGLRRAVPALRGRSQHDRV